MQVLHDPVEFFKERWIIEMKVLMITPDYIDNLYGGIGIYVNELIEALNNLEIEITLVITRIRKNKIDKSGEYIKSDRLKIINLAIGQNLFYDDIKNPYTAEQNNPFAPLKLSYINYEMSKKIQILMENEEFDLIHIHDAYFAEVGYMVKYQYDIPLVLTIHSMMDDKRKMMYHLRNFSLQNADKIIAVSKWVETKIHSIKMNQELKIEIVEPEKKEIQYKPYIYTEDEKKIILFVGRIEKNKGCLELLDAYKELKKIYDNIELQFVGTGSIEEDIKEDVYKNGVKDVTFNGYVENQEILEIMNKAYMVVIPSYEEPFGIVAIEAACASTCVVASGSGELGRILKKYHCGITFNYEFNDDMKNVMKKLIQNNKLRNEICSSIVFENDDLIGKKTLHVYRDALKDKNRSISVK